MLLCKLSFLFSGAAQHNERKKKKMKCCRLTERHKDIKRNEMEAVEGGVKDLQEHGQEGGREVGKGGRRKKGV